MSADAWLTAAVGVAVMVLLAMDRYQPALVMGGGVVVLLVSGVISEERALAGFANDAPITVAALYVLAGAAEVTGALDAVTERVLGRGERGERALLAKMAFPSMAASAFVANTPLVGMLAPRVVGWCRRTGRSPSRYLMPLSYAVIFGGCITMIGTSTNLVVAGLMRDADQDPIGLFEITPAGLPIAIVGVALIVLVAPRLLRERSTPGDDESGRVKEFTIEMRVLDPGPLIGRSVSEAGLRNLEGVFLFSIERDDRTVTPVGPDEVLEGGDRLVFAGNIARVVDLQRVAGLASAEEHHFSVAAANERRFFQAVIAGGSGLVGSTLKRSAFRARYGAAVVAIHRAGERVGGKLGEVRLHTGDVLLLVGGSDTLTKLRDHPDFLVVAPGSDSPPLRRERTRIVQISALAMIVLAGTGTLSLLQSSLIVAIALIGSGAITPAEARRAVDLDVILLMALSFGLGAAIADSGLAEQLSRGIVTTFEPLGDLGLLAGVLLATMLMTELLSNNAAAILMFPIAMATAASSGIDPRPFAAVILFGASLSFLTPIGYQANTLVWGMGGYRYRDFSRLGLPLTLATVVTVLVMTPIVFPLR